MDDGKGHKELKEDLRVDMKEGEVTASNKEEEMEMRRWLVLATDSSQFSSPQPSCSHQTFPSSLFQAGGVDCKEQGEREVRRRWR